MEYRDLLIFPTTHTVQVPTDHAALFEASPLKGHIRLNTAINGDAVFASVNNASGARCLVLVIHGDQVAWSWDAGGAYTGVAYLRQECACASCALAHALHTAPSTSEAAASVLVQTKHKLDLFRAVTEVTGTGVPFSHGTFAEA